MTIPITSFTQFDLSADILRALQSLGYTQPTDVQQAVIPIALQERDVTVRARTGSGKTAAFAIPICERVQWEENRPQALILTPTRELADQIRSDVTDIGRLKRVKAVALYGKQPFARQKLELRQKCHVVVGTPGRVLDHIQKGTLDVSKLRFLVIDEADELLRMGFIEQVSAIIDELPTARRTMLFSATLPEDVERLCHRYQQDPVDIAIQAPEEAKAQIEHQLLAVDPAEKLQALHDVLVVENPESCILFCRTQEGVDELFQRLDELGLPCDEIHGGMLQDDRFLVMNAFKRGEFRFLIATNVAARGIDVEAITHVINYDFPLEKESYVHRIGRTGRAGKAGKAITFLTPNEEKFVPEIEAYLGFDIPRQALPTAAEVAAALPAWERKLQEALALKPARNEQLNEGIMKLYFNGGKKKKLRAVDFVGTLTKLEGVTAEDIGIITIGDTASYVDILNGKGPMVLARMKHTTIKGKQLKVHEARK